MKNTNMDMLAGSRKLNEWEPTQIFAGESPITTDNGVASADIEMYQPVYRDGTGKLKPYDDTAAALDPKVYPVGISAQASKNGDNVPFYTGGTLNFEAITWPSTVTDLLAAKALFETHQATIIIKKLY